MARLLALVAEGNEDGAALLTLLKRDPGAVGLDSLLTEVNKLNDVRRLGLPEGLFADCSEKLVAAWRARAIKMYPSDFRDPAEDVRIPLLAALCSSRQAEITDALGDLLIALVQKINARAERRVERQITAESKKVRGKEGILFRLADAAIGQPDKTVRTALYPVVGEKTLRDLVAEAKANEKVFKAKVHTTLRSSYSFVLPADAAAAAADAGLPLQQHRLPAGDGTRSRCWGSTPGPTARPASTTQATWCRWTASCARTGARPSSMTRAASSASRTSCASWSRCAMRSGAVRSTSRGRPAGATRRTICPETSRPPAPCTTRRSVSRWTRGSSSRV
ncbi:hypothetical protein PH213_38835 [Streptomyces sp. SRF1]|uniref:hypothetical protein n=1 Tax=Streptomyces sp. SRF1 TaxID=1549642 RepID=UPI0025B278DA|nr:hypothetical protein [Streptomyces sp. SRF1]MDN3060371.1 hypothetical protein [Streptomyces sp. SRF1]